MAELDPELLKFLMSRGQGLEGAGVDPVFAQRLQAALQAAEGATGAQTQISDLYRSPERQAQYYAAYKAGKGGLAAPPGRSRHQLGQAADIRRGPVRDWMAENSGQYGIEPLKGPLARMDPVHFQMMRDWKGEIPAMPQTQVAAAPSPVGPQSIPGGMIPGLPPSDLAGSAMAVTKAVPGMMDKLKGFQVPSTGELSLARILPPSMSGADGLKNAASQGIASLQNLLRGGGPPATAFASSAPPGVAPSQEAIPLNKRIGKGLFGALGGLAQMGQQNQQVEQQHAQANADAEQKRMAWWMARQAGA